MAQPQAMMTSQQPTEYQNSSAGSSVASPLQVLEQLCRKQASGQLSIEAKSVQWHTEVDLGRITYVRHNVDPVGGFLHHLRHCHHGASPAQMTELCEQVKSIFEPGECSSDSPDTHQILMWLVDNRYVTPEQAVDVAEAITRHSFELLLCVTPTNYNFNRRSPRQVLTRSFDLNMLVEDAQKRLAKWRSMRGSIRSPHQRLYFVGQDTPRQRQLPDIHYKMRERLRGITLRQLALGLGQDELSLAQSLTPYVREKIIYLRDPQPPYDRLPNLTDLASVSTATLKPELIKPKSRSLTIACVDDSPSTTNEIRRHLDNMGSTIVTINDPLKALMNIIRLKPDLILMDVGMPYLDGYELCRLLRRHDTFKKTPIIMVTGHTGFLDRARATMVGATDYLTKPFEPSKLRKLVLQYLPAEQLAE